MRKLIDEKNKTYGLLTVLEETRDKNSRIAWKCRCVCGKEVIVRGPDLRAKRIISCGNCGATKNELGKRYGSLIVIEKVNNTLSKDAKWKCICDCGNIIETLGKSLRNGDTKSCGCIKSQGELLVGQYLTLKQIAFKKEFIFNDCINPETNTPFRFDFQIIINNKQMLIEYDGIQHFRKQNWGHITFEEIQKRDIIKNNYCENKNIPLLRISYKEINNIEELINNFILQYKE